MTWTSVLGLLAVTAAVGGCSLLKKSGDDGGGVAELLKPPQAPKFIRQAAVPRGLGPIEVTGVGLVNALDGSGGPADPSPYRDQLVDEMRRNDVKGASEILEGDSNAIVRVHATIPPAARRGETIDLRIDSPPGNNATDLHGGWLLDTRMRLQKLIQGRIRQGDILAMGTGRVVTRWAIKSTSDERMKTQGIILSGATIQKDRSMGLVLRPEYKHVKVASDIAAAINRRVLFFVGTTRRGVAAAVEDDYVELDLHPRYERSLGRYLAVVSAQVIDPREAGRQSRLAELASELEDPAKASDAALQLEALGESAIPTLIAGTRNENPELRFYAAEALAYLDRSEAIEPLTESIADEAAFRHPALAALGGMDHAAAAEALASLFDQASIETRYGAFVALRLRDDAPNHVTGQPVGESIRYYHVASAADPAVVLSTRREAEVVVFGDPSPIQLAGVILGPKALTIRSDPDSAGQIRISRFGVGKRDRRAVAPATVRGLLDGIIEVGGDYGDVIAVLRLAKSKGYLVDQLAIDPLPKPLRTYHREGDSSEEDEGFGEAVDGLDLE